MGERALSAAELEELGARTLEALSRAASSKQAARRLAVSQGLAPLLAASGIAWLDRRILKRARLRSLAAAEAASRASGALARRSVPHVFMKGFSVEPLYGRPGARAFGDLDVLIAPDAAARAFEALRGAGYESVPQRSPVEWVFLPRGRGPLSVPIDLHTALAHRAFFDPDTEGMLRRARSSAPLRSRPEVKGGIPVLSPEDEVLFAALHAARGSFRSAGRSLLDIAVLAAAAEPDWDLVRDRARAWRMRNAAWVALRAARLALGAAVPGEVIGGLRPPPATRALLRQILDFRRMPPFRLSSRLGARGAMAIMWPALLDGAYERLRFLARYAVYQLGKRLLGRAIHPPPRTSSPS